MLPADTTDPIASSTLTYEGAITTTKLAILGVSAVVPKPKLCVVAGAAGMGMMSHRRATRARRFGGTRPYELA